MIFLEEVDYDFDVPLHIKGQRVTGPGVGLLFRKTGKMLCGNARLGVEISMGYFSMRNQKKTKQTQNIRLQVTVKSYVICKCPAWYHTHDGFFGKHF